MSNPLSLTFVGRQSELTQLAEWLADPACRVIALIGPGGIGKTRLAQQAAALVETAFPHGVVFVPLAALVSSDFFIPAVAEALQFSFYGRDDPAGQLLNYLREKQLLLVFDSFEQTLPAARWVAELTLAAPQVKVLLTSRQQTGIEGERELLLGGMALPASDSADDFDDAPAVRLFLQNARLLNPSYEIKTAERPHVYRICEMLGGLPLAIQMAAAWTRAISCEQIAAEIDRDMDFLRAPFRSMPERHQSLKAIFDSSWRMLPYAERVICRQLSVFPNDFTPEVAGQVVGATEEQLASLVRQSLLQVEPSGRYRLHTTVRQYAAARLNQDADEALQTRQRHAAYVREFLQVREAWLKGHQQRQALQQIAEISEDVRTAWDFLLSQHEFAAIEAMVEGVYLFFSIRSRKREGWQLFERAVDVCQASSACPPETTARMFARQAAFALEINEYPASRHLAQACLDLNPRPVDVAFIEQLLGRLAMLADDHAEAIQYLQHSLEIYRQLGDTWGQARAFDGLGMVSWTLGDYTSAQTYFNHTLSTYRQLGEQQGIASALDHLGVVAREQNDFVQAHSYFEQSLAIFRDLDAPLHQAYVANHLGGIIAMEGDLASAEPYFEECISLGREIGERRIVAYTLSDWAWQLVRDPQQSSRAFGLFADALAIFESLGEQFGVVSVLTGWGAAAAALGDFAAAELHFQRALNIAVEIENPRLINEVLGNLADLFHQRGELARAVSLLAFVIANASPDWSTAEAQQHLDELRSLLPADEFERLVAEGRAQSLESIRRHL
jgi:predicted ATPase/Flp pilus assembly protein TadD